MSKIAMLFRENSIEVVKEVKKQKSASRDDLEDGEIREAPAPAPIRRRSRRLSGKFQGRFPKVGGALYDRTRKHFNTIADKR